MTPKIRDDRCTCFPEATMFTRAYARGAICFFVFGLLLFIGSSVSVPAPLRLSQDSGSKPVPASAARQSSAAPSKPSAPVSSEATPLQKAVHQKKVLTEEDLAKPAKVISPSDLDGEENNPLCDLSCEAELRAQMGFGPDREAEFQNQLTLARHDIGDDRGWNSTLQSALQAAEQYCEIQRQKERIVSKGAASPWIRDQVNSRFGERERKIISDYRESAGLLTQRIQTVQRFAPFQAAVMQYEVSETVSRICGEYKLP
jgi:hypothetical protein